MGPMDCDDGPEAVEYSALGFLHVRDKRRKSRVQVCPITAREMFKIGRDPRSNAFSTDPECDAVSRNHCEVYVVVYEPSVNHVYVRDNKSLNGTYVNSQLIGIGPHLSPGHLLQDGDTIEIRPHWQFLFRQANPPPLYELTSLQTRETELFADKYSLSQRCLGHGAEAVVYLAVEPATSKQLVCKMVNLEKIPGQTTSELRRRKLQEADTLRQLQHPHILAYIDAVVSPHTLYIFTELASGGDLMTFLSRQDSVQEFDARIIVRQIVRGLCYLHDKGIIHRDLKPENILLIYSPRIDCLRVVLSDFGTCAVPRRSRMITNVGTTNYQAPEFFLRQEAQTFSVDIWSLGIVILLLLTSDPESNEGGLNRLDQEELDEEVAKIFRRKTVERSSSGRKLIYNCLQVSPLARPGAHDILSHAWFSPPGRSCEEMDQLDRDMMEEWSEARQITPMPLTIPSLLNGRARLSSLFAYEDLVGNAPPSKQELRDSFGENSEGELYEPRNASTAAPVHAQSPMRPDDPKINVKTSHVTHISREHSGLRSGPDSKVVNRPRTKTNVEIRAPTQLSRGGLDRHRKPAVRTDQRQAVLNQLRETNSMFLT